MPARLLGDWASSVLWNAVMLRTTAFQASITVAILAGEALLFAQDQPPVAIDTAFSPDGTRFFTAGDDLSLRMWDARTGRSLQTWFPAFDEQRQFNTIAVSPEGRHLAVSGLTAPRTATTASPRGASTSAR